MPNPVWSARERVVASAAVNRDGDQARQAVAGRKIVIAAVAIDDEDLGGADVQAERGGGGAIEADARAVGGDREGLGAVAAVDLDRVGAEPASVKVVAVAGIPDHAIVAVLTEDLVIARAAGQNVIAGAAEERIGAPFAQEGVIA